MKREDLEKISSQYLSYLHHSDLIKDAFRSKNIYTRILCQLYLGWINDYNTEYALISIIEGNPQIYKKSYSFPDWKMLFVKSSQTKHMCIYFIRENEIFKLDLDKNNIYTIRDLFIKIIQFIEKRYINDVI